MKFGILEIENFLSVEKCILSLNDLGLVLIVGENKDSTAFQSNGAGKSTLFSEATTWCLFGKTIRGKKGDGVINTRTKGGTKVRQIILDGQDQYEIVRYRKHREHKNHVLLFKNRKNITGKSDKDTDLMIIDLLQMDYNTFTNSIMFGQSGNTFADSTDSQQKEILERMLQIDIFKACQKEAKERMKLAEKQYTDLENRLNSLVNERDSIESTIKDLQDKEANLQGEVQKNIEKIKLEMKQSITELESVSNTESLEDEITEVRQLMEAIKKQISKFEKHEASYKELEDELSLLKYNIKNTESQLSKNDKKLSDLLTGKNIPKICDACGQELPLEDTSHIENHLRSSIEEDRMKLEEYQSEAKEVKHLVTEVSKYMDTKVELEDELSNLRTDESNLKRDIKHYEKLAAMHQSAIRSHEERIKAENRRLEETYTELIQKNIDKALSIKTDILKTRSDLSLAEIDIKELKFWIDSFGNSGIKSKMLDSVTPFLNKRANKYLSKLTDGSVEVKFNTQDTLANGEKRDKFSVSVINENGDEDYKGNSTGERRRVDVAINMALQDLVLSRSNKNIDFICYDEVFDGLDGVGCELVIELLNDRVQECGSIAVITHNDNLKQLFTKSVMLEKRGGRTLITENSI